MNRDTGPKFTFGSFHKVVQLLFLALINGKAAYCLWNHHVELKLYPFYLIALNISDHLL